MSRAGFSWLARQRRCRLPALGGPGLVWHVESSGEHTCRRRASQMSEGVRPSVASGFLLERDRAQTAIGEALVTVAEGRGAAVFLVGPAGIGKTSLLEAGSQAAAVAGWVGSAVGSSMESALPFGLIDQATVALGGRRQRRPGAAEHKEAERGRTHPQPAGVSG